MEHTSQRQRGVGSSQKNEPEAEGTADMDGRRFEAAGCPDGTPKRRPWKGGREAVIMGRRFSAAFVDRNVFLL